MKNFLTSYFQISENKSSIRTEIIAGLTTYLTMCYILFVNPQILHLAGMDFNSVFVATCLTTALGSFLLGALANYPIVIAPGLALNVYFTYIVVQNFGYSWQDALGAVFISGILFLILTITKLRRWIIEAFPKNLNIAIAIGIGLFLMLIALKTVGLIEANTNTLLALAHIKSPKTLLFFLGFCLIVTLDHFKVFGGILIGILITATIGILLGVSQFHGIFAAPPSIKPTWLALHFHDLNYQDFSVIFSFLLVALFDSTGTLIGILLDPNFKSQQNKRLSHALFSDSIATIGGALLGTSSTSPFIESAAGIRAGGRTGLTAIFVALLFLLSLFLSPLATTIPNYAVTPALFYVGLLMVKHIAHLDLSDFTEFVPGIITFTMIPFTFSIANGVGLGIISYVLLKISCGKAKELNKMLIVLALVFLVFFILHPHFAHGAA